MKVKTQLCFFSLCAREVRVRAIISFKRVRFGEERRPMKDLTCA